MNTLLEKGIAGATKKTIIKRHTLVELPPLTHARMCTIVLISILDTWQ